LGWTRPATAGLDRRGHDTVPRIVARLLPAVVSITTRRIERDQFNRAVPRAGMGSGALEDRRGCILTNNHALQGFEEIKVTLTDGRSYRGRLVGGDWIKPSRPCGGRTKSPTTHADDQIP
jgi:serine protease Do